MNRHTHGIVLALLALVAGSAVSVPARDAASAPKPDAGSVMRIEHRDPTALPSRGPTNALVTVEVFFTPMPSARRDQYRHLERLQANHPSRVRIVYRILKGSMARFPYAALHAYSEGKFFEFIDALNNANRSLDDKALLELGKKIGLDPERLAVAISRPPDAYDELLDANQRRFRQRTEGNPSLPAVLFNGRWPRSASLVNMSAETVAAEYLTAKDAAQDLIDRGVARTELAAAFDQIITLPEEIEVQAGATDLELEDLSPEPRLALPPLSYAGLPSHGPAHAPLTIAVLCSPTSTNCNAPLSTAQKTADIYPDQVRVVWAPYYDVGSDDAADLGVLADAALCAERDGGRSIERDDTWAPSDSPGWRWVREVLAHTHSRQRARTMDDMLDKIVGRLSVEPRAFATCRARLAGTSIAFIEAARRAGVRSTPATIVNGRIYGPINDPRTLQRLVQAELAPGMLSPAWSQPELTPP
jgi:protein-disulfide isomerase